MESGSVCTPCLRHFPLLHDGNVDDLLRSLNHVHLNHIVMTSLKKEKGAHRGTPTRSNDSQSVFVRLWVACPLFTIKGCPIFRMRIARPASRAAWNLLGMADTAKCSLFGVRNHHHLVIPFSSPRYLFMAMIRLEAM